VPISCIAFLPLPADVFDAKASITAKSRSVLLRYDGAPPCLINWKARAAPRDDKLSRCSNVTMSRRKNVPRHLMRKPAGSHSRRWRRLGTLAADHFASGNLPASSTTSSLSSVLLGSRLDENDRLLSLPIKMGIASAVAARRDAAASHLFEQ
jgi:hypothetical protein